MIALFWLLAAVLAAAGLALLLPPLMRASPPPRPERRAAALAAYRERLEEIESGAGSEGNAPGGGRGGAAGDGERSDAARTLLRDLEPHDPPPGGERPSPERTPPRPIAAVVLGIAFPVLAAGLYTWLGEPRALSPAASRSASPAPVPAAAGAEAERLVAEAEATARANGNRLEGEPARLLERALALAPEYRKALWLAAVAALHEGRGGDARNRLERLRGLGSLDEREARIFERLMAQAKARASEP